MWWVSYLRIDEGKDELIDGNSDWNHTTCSTLPASASIQHIARAISIRLTKVSCIVCYPLVIFSISAFVRVIDFVKSAGSAFKDDIFRNVMKISPIEEWIDS